MTALTFVTVKWGTKYGSDYVNILFDSVRRNLPSDYSFSFLCFTDDVNDLLPGIETRPLPLGLTGWWNKLYLFKLGLFENGTRIFFLDLDTVIIDDLRPIAAYDGDFALLRDFYRSDGWQSAIMLWRGGFGSDIWSSFDAAGRPQIAGGDQSWIEYCKPKADILQDFFPNMIVSFKEKARFVLPPGVRIVCFHGVPRPHEVKNGWVEEVWKINGIIPHQSTAPQETSALENVRRAIALPLASLDRAMPTDRMREVCIVGCGASAKFQLDAYTRHRAEGHAIWALNGAFEWLIRNGLEPSAHIMTSPLAARAKQVPLATKALLFYASQCHPDILDNASKHSNRVVLWHVLTDGIRDLLAGRSTVVISGGGTSGTKSIALAHFQGYGRLHLYGFDSSLAAGEIEGNQDPTIDIEVDGQSFLSTAKLAQQVNDYRLLRQSLAPRGVSITVYGEGLLPTVAGKLGESGS